MTGLLFSLHVNVLKVTKTNMMLHFHEVYVRQILDDNMFHPLPYGHRQLSQP